MEQEALLPVQRFDIDWQMARSRPLDFDLFLHLPLNAKFICIRRKGQLLEPQKLQSLGALNFFVRKDEYQNFIKVVASQLGEIFTIKSEDQKKAAMLAARSLMRSTFSQEDPKLLQAMMTNLYNISSTIIESVLETSNLGTKRAFRVLSEMAEKGSSAQRHPVNVAALAVLMSYGVGYTSEKTLYAVSVAALLHDIGISKLPPDVARLADAPEFLNEEQRRLLYQHPNFSLDILRERKIKIPDLAARIISEHHENVDGSGYPLQLTSTQINEMTHILRLADEIDEKILALDPATPGLRLKLHRYFDECTEKKRFPLPLLARVRTVIL
jgi:HD-GYP domain-containing protein (c-di-GMP phosphodiesterase class II)